MRVSQYSFALSLLFHCALIILLYMLLRSDGRRAQGSPIRIQMTPPADTPGTVPIAAVPSTRGTVAPADSLARSAPRPETGAVRLRPDTLSWSRPAAPAAATAPLDAAFRDSVLKRHALDWRDEIARLSAIKDPENPVSEMLRQQNDGSNPVFLNPGSGNIVTKKQPAPRFDFIPTTEQVAAIARLSTQGASTQIDLYANLDSAVVTTAEQFNRSLEELHRKGFLRRKKISPQNIMQVVTPLGSMPVEMSRKNRINPVWEYELNISKSRLIDYLQARLDAARQQISRTPQDSARIAARIKELQGKILLLI
ncbi:hypothetical protein JXO52_15405 [bacterium]|nr:hypothetical protein [bacterium]